MISHPFFWLWEDDVASQELEKVHDITIACYKMTWNPRNY
jgi:hypothetical protein